MQAIGENTVLAQRYTLTRQLAGHDDQEQWIAVDATLGREVTATVFPEDSDRAEAALDSARRAAGVEDHHLPRVLDVGSEDGTAYVISEALHGAESIAAMLQFDPLPAEEVRRMVGESASGLGAAAARGLHHLQLTPHDIVCSPDGSVSVLGLPTDAALAGSEDLSSEAASREDTVALVQIVYAGLTGQWPGENHVPGLPDATRRVDGELPAPSELVSGVPGDLDTLCRTTLGADEGPRTPGELARQLAPWSTERVTTPARRATGAGGRPSAILQAVPGRRDAVDDAPERADARTSAPTSESAAPTLAKTPPSDPGALPAMPEGDETAQIPAALLMQARERTVQPPDPDDDWDPSFSDLEPPVPGLSGLGHHEPDHKSSRLALLIVALLVVVAVIFAAIGLNGIGGSSTPAKSSASVSKAPSAPASSTPPADQTPVATPVAITNVTTWGINGGENPGLAKNVNDGDPTTDWHTLEYRTAAGNGNGTGLLINLGKTSQIGSVAVTTTGGSSTVEVFVSDSPQGVTGRSPVATLTGSGTQTAKLSNVQAQYITLWVTQLSQQAGGKFQEQINEVKVFP